MIIWDMYRQDFIVALAVEEPSKDMVCASCTAPVNRDVSSIYQRVLKMTARGVRQVRETISHFGHELLDEIAIIKDGGKTVERTALKRQKVLQLQIAKVRGELDQLDCFFKREDVINVCLKIATLYNHLIVKTSKTQVLTGTKDPIQAASALKLELIDLQAELREKLLFIERHQEILDLYRHRKNEPKEPGVEELTDQLSKLHLL